MHPGGSSSHETLKEIGHSQVPLLTPIRVPKTHKFGTKLSGIPEQDIHKSKKKKKKNPMVSADQQLISVASLLLHPVINTLTPS